MWPGFEKLNVKLDNNSSQHETIDHISTIAGSLASLETEHTESPVSVTYKYVWLLLIFQLIS